MSLQVSLIASFLGRGWSALMLLLFTPLLISLLGIEGYGLIGFFNSLVIFFSLFDFGFGAALNRELAKKERTEEGVADLVKTIEYACWALSFIIGLLLFFIMPFIAERWLSSDSFSLKELYLALLLMGGSLLFQLPFSLYCNALQGLQKQVKLNGVLIFSVSLRYIGAILLLQWIGPTLRCFFGWQLFISFFQTLLMRYFLQKEIKQKGCFQKKLILDLWSFALGMGGITMTGLLLNHIDKLILSKMLSLKAFGYYALAWSCSNGLYCVFAPFFSVFFPKFSHLLAKGDQEALKMLYHRASLLLSLLLLPLSLGLCFFSKELLLFWTRDAKIVEQSAPLLSLLVVATAMHGLMQMPFALQFAHGWTRLTFFQNLAGIILLIPLIALAVSAFGPIGGTLAWLLLNLSYLFVGTHLMHQRLLKAEKWRWYLHDVGVPLLGSLAFFVSAKFFFQSTMLISLIFIFSLLFKPSLRKTILWKKR